MRWTTRKLNWNNMEVEVLEFELENPITPEQLEEIEKTAPIPTTSDILVLSGRGPIYLYAVLLHKYQHLVKALAVFDPKLNGAVIVTSHFPEIKIGQVITLGENNDDKDK